MNKEKTHKARNEAINEAKGKGRIYFSEEVEHFKDGFDAAIKIFSNSNLKLNIDEDLDTQNR